jgi:hypothetical protein
MGGSTLGATTSTTTPTPTARAVRVAGAATSTARAPVGTVALTALVPTATASTA